MKTRIKLLLVVIITLLLNAQPAAADGVSVSLDKSKVKVGDVMKASGNAKPGEWVAIKIVDSNQSIVFYDEVKADANGTYSKNDLIIPQISPGTVTLVAGYGSDVATAKLIVGSSGSSGGGGGGSSTSTTITNPITVTPSQPVTPVQEPVKENKTPATSLVDVKGSWAEAGITRLVNEGVISGYPDGSFKPDKTVSRAEFITMLVKAFKIPARQGKVFADTSDSWAKDFIATAIANGIAAGYSDESFGPDDPVTREQMVVMIVKAARLTPASGGIAFTDDDSISSWAGDAINIATQHNIISGYADQSFKPNNFTSRAEAVTALLKALE